MKRLLELLLPFSKACLLTLLGAAVASTVSSAQCPIHDQLDGGPCCTVANEFIPPFKKVTQDSLDICWRDCGPAFVGPCRAVWTPLHVLPTTGIDCGYRRTRLDIYDPLGTLQWSGIMRLL